MSLLVATLCVIVAVPVAFFLSRLQQRSSYRQRSSVFHQYGNPQRLAVLVPAHNESIGILPTLNDIKRRSSFWATDCSSSRTIATMILRPLRGRSRRGGHRASETLRGVAKDMPWTSGSSISSVDPPAIVIVIDADCRISRRSNRPFGEQPARQFDGPCRSST